ncbi:hypothetical protein SAMN05444008_1232 [Cnuella takakiae]|uniref:Uncharacterized protein n=1 Tax=Cnuella takakiae TaxID=1302690 RepID=A0A1M5IBN9_9BACT|nr:hypothetical protein [Cnuella takakiae]OLY90774.1 hypothetical protein BUE76_01820 [Cnuella takakiae]SHG25310.1 hypothetical protein SAMN05444008_1232 [Cnuella takakiae]
MKITKLGEPAFRLYYQPGKALYIPVYIIRNTAEDRLFTHFYCNTKAAGIRMVQRRAYIRQPYDGQNYFKQPYYAQKLIDALLHIAMTESVRFDTLCSVNIGRHTYFFDKGVACTSLPEGYNPYGSDSQTEESVRAFCHQYHIDSKEFNYPSARLNGSYSF